MRRRVPASRSVSIAAVVIALMAVTFVLDTLAVRASVGDERQRTADIAQAEVRLLGDELARAAGSVDGLVGFIESNNRSVLRMRSTFPTFAEFLMPDDSALRSVQVASRSVLTLVHPVEGNEAAIGLDLFADIERRRLLTDAVERSEPVLEGPIDLVQGGRGIVIRDALTRPDGGLWGFAAVVADWDLIAERVGEGAEGFVVDVRDSSGRSIGGAPVSHSLDPIVVTFDNRLLEAPWSVRVIPAGGWPTGSPYSAAIWLLGSAVALLAGMAVSQVLRRPEVLAAERARVLTSLEAAERRYGDLYTATPVAIHHEDHSEVAAAVERLRAAGIDDVKAYLAERPDLLRDIVARVRILDMNAAAVALSERAGVGHEFVDRYEESTRDAFLEGVAAIAQGAVSVSYETSTTDVRGEPLHIAIRWYAGEVADGAPYSNVFVALQDITEVVESRRRVEEALASKNRFIASISHQLRTPLTAVLGFSSELRNPDSSYTPNDREEFLELIEHHAVEMGYMIEDLLVWTRADLGEVTINSEPFDLAETARRAVRAIDAGVVDISGAGDLEHPADGDPLRTRQIMRNLVTNALRYGGPDVRLVTCTTELTCWVEVSDDGPMIAPERVERMFKPFERLEESTTMPGSIGLGLSVSRTLAELQGGSLEFRRVDGRNTFRLTLPSVAATRPRHTVDA